MDKKSLRAWAKEFDKSKCSKELIELLKKSVEYQKAKNIMIFYPLKKEINLLPLLEDESKNFFLPKVDGKNLLCCPYKKEDELCSSCFKTLEPQTQAVDKNSIDLIIVPALCCDKHNYRLGYGGGFYDRLLKNYVGKTIICLPKELIVESIFPESYDIAVGKVICC